MYPSHLCNYSTVIISLQAVLEICLILPISYFITRQLPDMMYWYYFPSRSHANDKLASGIQSIVHWRPPQHAKLYNR